MRLTVVRRGPARNVNEENDKALNTVRTKPSRVTMPQFMPTASDESVLPVQAAQASNDDGAMTTAPATAARLAFISLQHDFIDSSRS